MLERLEGGVLFDGVRLEGGVLFVGVDGEWAR